MRELLKALGGVDRPLRVLAADEDPAMIRFYQEVLPGLGYEVAALAGSCQELGQACRALRPDLILTEARLPDGDASAAVQEVCRQEPVPVVLVSAEHDPDCIVRALNGPALAYLVKPVQPADLQTAIPLAVRRFAEFQALWKEAAELRQALAERKLVERAKGAVMKRLRVDEPEAFRRLQRMSRDQNRRLVDVAQSLLAAEEVFASLDESGSSAPGPVPAACSRPGRGGNVRASARAR
jgi:two-component system, response regulator PdtaR